MTAQPPLSFDVLGDKPTGVWRRPRRFGFADRIGTILLSDSELLQTSLYLPLAVRESAGTCEVVAVVHSALLARPVVRADGRWLPFYMPIALRCLPFRHARGTTGKTRGLEITTDLHRDGDGPIFPFLTDGGRMHQEFATATSLLDRLEAGRAALSKGAASLLAADLLVKLTSVRPEAALPPDTNLLVVDPARLGRLSHARTVALARDGLTALDLATACCFSSRLWAPHLGPDLSADRDTPPAVGEQTSLDHRMSGSFAIELRIDDSALFSFDAFVTGDARQVDPG